jgi:hypothetical protein
MTIPAVMTEALHNVWGEIHSVGKDGTNKFHKYKYASEANVISSLRPVLHKHGLMLIQSSVRVWTDEYKRDWEECEYTLVHKDGFVWPEKIRAFGCGQDMSKDGKVGDKGLYKAITGRNKYGLMKLFQLETADDPENDAGVQTSSKHQYNGPAGAMKAMQEKSAHKDVMALLTATIPNSSDDRRDALLGYAAKLFGPERAAQVTKPMDLSAQEMLKIKEEIEKPVDGSQLELSH